jgi:hypothetical protein
MLGAYRKIIVSITHLLVVERFYSIFKFLSKNAKVNIVSS